VSEPSLGSKGFDTTAFLCYQCLHIGRPIL
jgi:hypothetical protein